MRTRNGDAPKPAPARKTPPSRKAAAKTTPEPSAESESPKTADTRRGGPVAGAKQGKSVETTPPAPPVTPSDATPEQSPVEEAKTSSDVTPATADAKPATHTRKKVVKRVVKRFVKKTPGKVQTPAASEVPLAQTPKTEEDMKIRVEASTKDEVEEAKDTECGKKEDAADKETALELEEPRAKDIVESAKKGESAEQMEEPVVESLREDQSADISAEESSKREQLAMEIDVPLSEVARSSKIEEPGRAEKGEEVKEELEKVKTKNVDDRREPRIDAIDLNDNVKDSLPGEVQPEQDEYGGDDGYEYGDRVDFEDHGEDDFVEDDPDELAEEAETLEEERRELTAIAKERKNRKEYEIFVGGLERDATEDDVRKVFENIGKVVEVRLHRNFSTNRNKGYAFVKFANKEHAKRALSEMKNPVIHGKRCGTAPSEDNDTLFLGNVCNTWTKEAIRQKLKDYGIEGVENITLVPDVQHEGRSRGFAFLEFSCHPDAMLAYRRLQKPDVVFGHPERTAKVAFAEPIREPDPEIMAQVKTVFLDGLPLHWNESRVWEYLKGYGNIVRIVLARNMPTARRKDFGFVDFSTHEAAVACIDGIKKTELIDGNSKIRLKARLSNPLPKTQAVKGGMRGGFRIGHASSGTFSRFGRGFGRGGHHFGWQNFQRDRGFHQRGHGQTSRMGPNDYDYDDRYSMSHGRQILGRGLSRGGRRGPPRGGYHPAGRGVATAGSSRPSHSRPWHDAPERWHMPSRRQLFSPEAFERPFAGRHYDDPYFYDDGAHGMKRPFHMIDHDPDYVEPSRHRQRLDYPAPAAPFRGAHYRDTYGGGSDSYSDDYYGPEYGAYPSYYGNDRSYGGGYYY